MVAQEIDIEALLLDHWYADNFSAYLQTMAETPQYIQYLFKLKDHKNPKLAWRSAYMLDKIHNDYPKSISPHLPKLIREIAVGTNMSIKRHYLRILCQYDLSTLANGKFINHCFYLITQRETPIAVRVHAMQILYNLSLSYPELIEELTSTLAHFLPYASKGEKHRINKLLAKF